MGIRMEHTKRMMVGACYGLLLCAAVTLGVVILILNPRPGIGDPEVAIAKISRAATKEDVLLLLGKPHIRVGDSKAAEVWHYRCNFVGGEILSVYFGPDGRFRRAESWLQ